MYPHRCPRCYQRAGFLRHALWVTPYAEGEMYPTGDYPVQQNVADGIPHWAANDRPLVRLPNPNAQVSLTMLQGVEGWLYENCRRCGG